MFHDTELGETADGNAAPTWPTAKVTAPTPLEPLRAGLLAGPESDGPPGGPGPSAMGLTESQVIPATESEDARVERGTPLPAAGVNSSCLGRLHLTGLAAYIFLFAALAYFIYLNTAKRMPELDAEQWINDALFQFAPVLLLPAAIVVYWSESCCHSATSKFIMGPAAHAPNLEPIYRSAIASTPSVSVRAECWHDEYTFVNPSDTKKRYKKVVTHSESHRIPIESWVDLTPQPRGIRAGVHFVHCKTKLSFADSETAEFVRKTMADLKERNRSTDTHCSVKLVHEFPGVREHYTVRIGSAAKACYLHPVCLIASILLFVSWPYRLFVDMVTTRDTIVIHKCVSISPGMGIPEPERLGTSLDADDEVLDYDPPSEIPLCGFTGWMIAVIDGCVYLFLLVTLVRLCWGRPDEPIFNFSSRKTGDDVTALLWIEWLTGPVLFVTSFSLHLMAMYLGSGLGKELPGRKFIFEDLDGKDIITLARVKELISAAPQVMLSDASTNGNPRYLNVSRHVDQSTPFEKINAALKRNHGICKIRILFELNAVDDDTASHVQRTCSAVNRPQVWLKIGDLGSGPYEAILVRNRWDLFLLSKLTYQAFTLSCLVMLHERILAFCFNIKPSMVDKALTDLHETKQEVEAREASERADRMGAVYQMSIRKAVAIAAEGSDGAAAGNPASVERAGGLTSVVAMPYFDAQE